MAIEKDSCVKPATGPILKAEKEKFSRETSNEEVLMVKAQVGKEAPDFEASAYINGEGFKNESTAKTTREIISKLHPPQNVETLI